MYAGHLLASLGRRIRSAEPCYAESMICLPAPFMVGRTRWPSREGYELRRAVSIGHGDTMLRDQLLEDLDWFSPVQRLAWSAIQFRRYFIKFLLGVQGQVGAFREVLPKQPVRVLVGAALPRRARVAEIDRQAGTDSEIGVTRHFLALIPGHAVSQEFGKCFHFTSQERSDAIGAAIVGNPHEHGEPASPLD